MNSRRNNMVLLCVVALVLFASNMVRVIKFPSVIEHPHRKQQDFKSILPSQARVLSINTFSWGAGLTVSVGGNIVYENILHKFRKPLPPFRFDLNQTISNSLNNMWHSGEIVNRYIDKLTLKRIPACKPFANSPQFVFSFSGKNCIMYDACASAILHHMVDDVPIFNLKEDINFWRDFWRTEIEKAVRSVKFSHFDVAVMVHHDPMLHCISNSPAFGDFLHLFSAGYDLLASGHVNAVATFGEIRLTEHNSMHAMTSFYESKFSSALILVGHGGGHDPRLAPLTLYVMMKPDHISSKLWNNVIMVPVGKHFVRMSTAKPVVTSRWQGEWLPTPLAGCFEIASKLLSVQYRKIANVQNAYASAETMLMDLASRGQPRTLWLDLFRNACFTQKLWPEIIADATIDVIHDIAATIQLLLSSEVANLFEEVLGSTLSTCPEGRKEMLAAMVGFNTINQTPQMSPTFKGSNSGPRSSAPVNLFAYRQYVEEKWGDALHSIEIPKSDHFYLLLEDLKKRKGLKNIEYRIEKQDESLELLQQALCGRNFGISLTGGIAQNKYMTQFIRDLYPQIPVHVSQYPNDYGMLFGAAWSVVAPPKTYSTTCAAPLMRSYLFESQYFYKWRKEKPGAFSFLPETDKYVNFETMTERQLAYRIISQDLRASDDIVGIVVTAPFNLIKQIWVSYPSPSTRKRFMNLVNTLPESYSAIDACVRAGDVKHVFDDPFASQTYDNYTPMCNQPFFGFAPRLNAQVSKQACGLKYATSCLHNVLILPNTVDDKSGRTFETKSRRRLLRLLLDESVRAGNSKLLLIPQLQLPDEFIMGNNRDLRLLCEEKFNIAKKIYFINGSDVAIVRLQSYCKSQFLPKYNSQLEHGGVDKISHPSNFITTSSASLINPSNMCSAATRANPNDVVFSSFPGKWIKDDTRQTLAYTFDTCPFMLRLYACDTFDQKRALDVAQRRYLSPSCELQSFDSKAFMQCNRNRRIIVIGDSLLRQMFISIACQLTHGLTAGIDYKYELSTQLDMPMPWSTVTCPEWYRGKCYYFQASATLTNGVTLKNQYLQKYDRARWKLLMKMYGIESNDVLLLSLGLFYYSELDAYKADMLELLTYLDLEWTGHSVYFREHSPSHFSGKWTNGKYDGDKNATCSEDAETWRPYHEALVMLLSECRRGTERFASNKGTQKRQCEHIHYIPVYDLSTQQSDAHFGMFGQKPSNEEKSDAKGARDCTHWCLPSATVDTWTTLFSNMLCNSNKA